MTDLKEHCNKSPKHRPLNCSDSVTHSYKTLHKDIEYLTSFCRMIMVPPVFSNNLRIMGGKHYITVLSWTQIKETVKYSPKLTKNFSFIC